MNRPVFAGGKIGQEWEQEDSCLLKTLKIDLASLGHFVSLTGQGAGYNQDIPWEICRFYHLQKLIICTLLIIN